MKKIFWIAAILVCFSILLFPKRVHVVSLNVVTGQSLEEKSSIYLAPIWSRSYSSHLVSFVSLPEKSKGPDWITSAVDYTDRKFNTKYPEYAIHIWIIFYLLPSIFLLLFFIFQKKSK